MFTHLVPYCLLALPLLCLGGVVAPDDRARHDSLLLAFLDALRAAKLTTKDACAYLRISQQRWSQIERGEAHLPSLTRMANLPDEFWYAFIPSIVFIVTRRRMLDIRHDNQERKRA